MQCLRLVVALLFVCCLSFSVDAKKSKKTPPSKYSIVVGNGDKVSMQVRTKKNVYTLFSNDKKLTKNGFTKATVVYDYSKKQGVMVVVTGKGKAATCFYMNTPVSKSDFQASLSGQVNTDVNLGNTIALDAMGEVKTGNQAKKILKTMSSVKQLCKKAGMVELKELDPNANMDMTKNTSIMGLDSDITLVETNSIVAMNKLPSFMLNKLGGVGGSSSGGSSSTGNNNNNNNNKNNKKNKNKGKKNKKAKGKNANAGGNSNQVSLQQVSSGGASAGAAANSGGASVGGGQSGNNGKNNNKQNKNKNKKNKNKGKNNAKGNSPVATTTSQSQPGQKTTTMAPFFPGGKGIILPGFKG